MDPRPKTGPGAAARRTSGETNPPTGTVAQPRPSRAPDPLLSTSERPDEIGRLGPYRILAELGRGGMGVVYRAENPLLGREVAIKVLAPHLAADAKARDRFIREARNQARVEHGHVAPVLHADEVNGVAYLVMPLLKGQTLADALGERPRMPAAEAVRIAREVAEGLAAAHAKSLVHRDIKPANVWLEGERRRVKVLDFGLARDAGAEADLTTRGALVGTPAYMSPEQAKCQPVDHRTDLWSLGVVLYEMLTGERPFGGPDRRVLLYAITAAAPRDPRELAPEVPPALADLVLRLLAKDPGDRPPSAAAVATELEFILAALSAAPDVWSGIDAAAPLELGEPEGQREPASRRSLPTWAWAAVGLAILAAAALGLVAWLAPGPGGNVGTTKRDPEEPPVLPKILPGAPMPHRVVHTHEDAVDAIMSREGLLFLGNTHFTTPEQVRAARAKCWIKIASGEYAYPVPVDAKAGKPGPVAHPFTDADLGAVASLDVDYFERVYLIGQGVTDAGIGRLLAIPSVRNTPHLDLTNCTAVGDDSLRHAARLPLTTLDVSGTAVTDAGLAHLSGNTRLTRISLQKTAVSDAGVLHLRRLAALQNLDLRGTAVTQTGYDAIRAALPKCRVWWNPPK